LDERVEVRAEDSHTPADPERGQLAAVYPVADRLLVELENAGDLGDGPILIRIGAGHAG
jgi:hypothetical protein